MKNGFTLIELLISVAIAGIGCAFLFSIATGNSIVPSKQRKANICLLGGCFYARRYI